MAERLRPPLARWPALQVHPHVRPKAARVGRRPDLVSALPDACGFGSPRPIGGLCPLRGKADAARGRLRRGCTTVS